MHPKDEHPIVLLDSQTCEYVANFARYMVPLARRESEGGR